MSLKAKSGKKAVLLKMVKPLARKQSERILARQARRRVQRENAILRERNQLNVLPEFYQYITKIETQGFKQLAEQHRQSPLNTAEPDYKIIDGKIVKI